MASWVHVLLGLVHHVSSLISVDGEISNLLIGLDLSSASCLQTARRNASHFRLGLGLALHTKLLGYQRRLHMHSCALVANHLVTCLPVVTSPFLIKSVGPFALVHFVSESILVVHVHQVLRIRAL